MKTVCKCESSFFHPFASANCQHMFHEYMPQFRPYLTELLTYVASLSCSHTAFCSNPRFSLSIVLQLVLIAATRPSSSASKLERFNWSLARLLLCLEDVLLASLSTCHVCVSPTCMLCTYHVQREKYNIFLT